MVARAFGSRPAPAPRALFLATVAAGVAALFLALAVSRFVNSSGYGFDFNCYFTGAQRLVAGQNIYLPFNLDGPFQHGGPTQYVYAPPLAVLLAPVSSVPFAPAAFAWLLLHLGALVASCALMPVTRPVRLAAFAVAAFSSPFLVDLNLGNVSVFVLLAAVVGWRWLDRPVAAIALAVSMAVRPQMGMVLAWWLVRREWRAAAWTIATGAVLILLTLPFVGITGYVDFLRVVRNMQVAGVLHNGSLESAAILVGLPAPLPTVAFLAGVAFAVGAVAASLRRDPELSYVVTVVASLLVTPLLWGHYLVLLLVPAAFLAQRGRPWALALPLLGWLPDGAIALAAFAGLLLPFTARPPAGPTSNEETGGSRRPVPAPAVG